MSNASGTPTKAASTRLSATIPAHTGAVALAVAAFALILGSIWINRFQNVFDSQVFSPLNRVCSIAALIVLAGMSSRLPAKPRPLFALGTASCAIHIVATLIATNLDSTLELMSFGVFSSVFEGVSLAVCSLMAFVIVSTLPLRTAVFAITSVLVLAGFYDCLFIFSSPAVSLVQWLVGAIVAYGLLGLSVFRYGGDGLFERACNPAGSPDTTPSDGNQGIALSFKALGLTEVERAFFFFAIALLLVQGWYTEMTGLGGQGDNGFYGLYSAIIVLLTYCVAMGYCTIQNELISKLGVAAVATLVFIVTVGLICLRGVQDAGLIASFVREAVTRSMQVLSFAIGMVALKRHPAHAFGIAALALSTMTMTHITRLLSYVTFHGVTPPNTLVVAVSFAAITIVVGAALWVAYQTGRDKAASRAITPIQDSATAIPNQTPDASPLVAASVNFARRFEELASERGLTPRERDVLFEAVHGYTIDHIARKLSLSREAIKSSLTRAYARAGVSGKQAFLALMDGEDEVETSSGKL